MQTVITAADPADFLALVPALAGFHPRRSLVLVPFHGSRSLGVVRVDLLPDDEVDAGAATLIGMVCKVDRADGFAAVVYTDDPLHPDDGPQPQTRLIEALRDRADLCGLQVKDALCVASDGWGSYLDPNAPPRALAEIRDRAADPLVAGHPVVADQTAGCSLPDADLASRERAGRALAALDSAVQTLMQNRTPGGISGSLAEIDPRALAAAVALDDLPELFEDALDWTDGLDPFESATLLWCLRRPSLRDVALTQWCEDIDAGGDALEAQLAWEGGAEYPERIARRFWGEGPRPNAARLLRALEVVRHVAAVAPRAERPGPLAAAAWISWALGRSTHADGYAARALEIDPDHGLSQIVLTMVSAGHLPEWAFLRG